jgi:hypothetical protein
MRAPDSAPANWKPGRAHYREDFGGKAAQCTTTIEEDNGHEIRESIDRDERENGFTRGLRKTARMGKRVWKKVEKWAKGKGAKVEWEDKSRDEGRKLRVNHAKPTTIHSEQVARLGGRKRGDAFSYPCKEAYDRDEGMRLGMEDREETGRYHNSRN